jgi:subtilisin family serine protease
MKKRAYINAVLSLVFVSFVVTAISLSEVKSNNEYLLEDIMNFKAPLDSAFTKPTGKQWKLDEIIIKFKDDVSTSKAYSIISNAKHIAKLDDKALYKIKLSNQTVEQAIAQYKNNPYVEYVQPEYIYTIAAIPNDPGFGSQWAIRNTGQFVQGNYSTHNPGCSGCDVKVTQVWDYHMDCSNIVVAVVDTGINYIHEELKDNMWDGSSKGYQNHGYNFVDNNNDPMDYNSHGTHVAGIIGAAANNGIGVAGVCWKANLMAVKVLSDDGTGYTSDVVKGVYFAVDNGAKIINLSLGNNYRDYALWDAIRYAKNKGVLIIAAAGNNGRMLSYTYGFYPCMYGEDNIICVGALDQNLALASFTNYSLYDVVHIYAPGVNIISSATSTVLANIHNNVLSQSGWNMSDSNWGIHNNLGYLAATNPPNFNYSVTYKPNLKNSYLYKTFNVSGYTHIGLMYEGIINVEINYDYFKILYATGTKNPVNGGFTQLVSMSVDKKLFESYFHKISNCQPLCTIAFSIESDNIIEFNGVVLRNMSIYGIEVTTDTYKIFDGTSMATPMVTGTAALLWSFFPSSSYLEIKKKILNAANVVPFPNNGQYTYRILNVEKAMEYLSVPQNVKVFAK